MELLNHIVRGKKIVIFGAGDAGKKVSQKINAEIAYFVDNDQKKWGRNLLGCKIVSPEMLLAEDKNRILIIIASMYHLKISKQLLQMGFQKNINFFVASVPKKKQPSVYLPQQNLTMQRSVDNGKLIFDINNNIYRGYSLEHSEGVKDILKRCQQSQLFHNNYIVPTEISDMEIPPFSLLLKHAYIRPFSGVKEWSPLMIFEAALKTIEIMEKLNEIDLTLHDPNTANITYYNNNFIWSDFGSIIDNKDGVMGLKKLVINENADDLSFLQKLILIHKKKFSLNCRFEYKSPAYGFFDEKSKKEYEEFIDRLNILFLENKNSHKQFIRLALILIKKFIKKYEIRVDENLYNYYNEIIKNNWFDDIREIIFNFIKNNAINNLCFLDFGGKYDKKVFFFFHRARKEDLTITVIQDDEEVNDVIYKLSNNLNLLCYPFVTKKYNIWIHSPENNHDFEQRVANDLLVALSFVHEMVFYRQRTFEDVVNILKGLTKKYVIIEFLTEQHWMIKQLGDETYSWYTLERFLNELAKEFVIEDFVDMKNNKKIIICKLD